MKNSIIKILILIVSAQAGMAQNAPFFKTYSWEKEPKYAFESKEDEAMVALKDKVVNELYFENDNSLVEYELRHKVLWLNSDEKIEAFNKVYIPYYSSTNIEVSKARVIKKDGSIIELDKSKILSAEDQETGRKYRYFAFEGIEKGSFIEYFYVLKKSPNYSGKKLVFQSDYRKKNIEFDLYAPQNLVFQFKSYNQLPDVVSDTLSESKKHWMLRLDELSSLEEEAFSAYDASRAGLVYKLDENLANGKKGLTSYTSISKRLYTYYYPEYSRKTKSLIGDFLAEVKLKASDKSEEKIRKIESYIKTKVIVSKASGKEFSALSSVIKNKVANQTGILNLYVAILRHLEIKHELVLTSDRQNLKFDKDFEAQNFLTDFLLYFPKTKKYLAPIEVDSRYGFPPAYLTDNYGLFIKEVTLGEFKSSIGKVKYIKPIKAKHTVDQMELAVTFDKEDVSTTIVSLERSLGGYYAMYIQPYINLIVNDKRKELMEGFAKNINENVEILKTGVENDKPELFGVKPFKVLVDFKSDAFVDKAGRKYLFKMGELIGVQTQLYQEKERVLPVENEFQRSYLRKISIEVPEGYVISNLKDIVIDESYSVGEKQLLSFKSSYEVKGNLLTIIADEHYRVNILKADVYEEYRKVINSAADFNKITLVLERK